MDTKPAALEYARQMRLALCQEGGELPHCPLTFGYWKRLFDRELAAARKQERLRMALSQDWSDLGKYVREGLMIAPHRILLDTAGLLLHLRFPGAHALFAPQIYRSCAKVLSTMTSISGQG